MQKFKEIRILLYLAIMTVFAYEFEATYLTWFGIIAIVGECLRLTYEYADIEIGDLDIGDL